MPPKGTKRKADEGLDPAAAGPSKARRTAAKMPAVPLITSTRRTKRGATPPAATNSIPSIPTTPTNAPAAVPSRPAVSAPPLPTTTTPGSPAPAPTTKTATTRPKIFEPTPTQQEHISRTPELELIYRRIWELKSMFAATQEALKRGLAEIARRTSKKLDGDDANWHKEGENLAYHAALMEELEENLNKNIEIFDNRTMMLMTMSEDQAKYDAHCIHTNFRRTVEEIRENSLKQIRSEMYLAGHDLLDCDCALYHDVLDMLKCPHMKVEKEDTMEKEDTAEKQDTAEKDTEEQGA